MYLKRKKKYITFVAQAQNFSIFHLEFSRSFVSSSVEDLYESVNDREIRQVFEGQNRIHLEIKQLNRQLAMILDEQRRYVSVITEEVAKKGANAGSGQVSVSETHSHQMQTTLIFGHK